MTRMFPPAGTDLKDTVAGPSNKASDSRRVEQNDASGVGGNVGLGSLFGELRPTLTITLITSMGSR